MLFYFATASVLAERTHWFQSAFWSQSALVVYAGHTVSVLPLCGKLCANIITDDARLLWQLVRYFTIPLLCVALLTGVFYLLYRFVPVLTYPFVGKPNTKKVK
jgi:hypothetical protein